MIQETAMMVCVACGHEKTTADFYPSKRNLSGFTGQCKECIKNASSGRYRKIVSDPIAREALLAKQRLWGSEYTKRPEVRARLLEYQRERHRAKVQQLGYRDVLRGYYRKTWLKLRNDPERYERVRQRKKEVSEIIKLDPVRLEKQRDRARIKSAAARQNPITAEKHRQISRDYFMRNKPKVYAARKQRRIRDPQFRIGCNMRGYITNLIGPKPDRNKSRFLELVGCSISDFKKHLESQFEPWMTWGNYGGRRGCWSIDHIKPCASFDLIDPEQQRKCFHFSNCRPMDHIGNVKKRARIEA